MAVPRGPAPAEGPCLHRSTTSGGDSRTEWAKVTNRKSRAPATRHLEECLERATTPLELRIHALARPASRQAAQAGPARGGQGLTAATERSSPEQTRLSHRHRPHTYATEQDGRPSDVDSEPTLTRPSGVTGMKRTKTEKESYTIEAPKAPARCWRAVK